MRIAPYRRPCLSVAFTFSGRSSALPPILMLRKGTKKGRHMQAYGHFSSQFRQILTNRRGSTVDPLHAISYAFSIFPMSMGMPHSTRAIALTRWHIVTLSSYLMGCTGDSPEKAHTVSMYFKVSFSDDGAHVDTIEVTVFLPYRRMYRRRMRNAALKPYSMVTNSSNSWSVGLFLSPSQVLPILMFRGLLLRIPRGCNLVILFIPEVPHTYY